MTDEATKPTRETPAPSGESPAVPSAEATDAPEADAPDAASEPAIDPTVVALAAMTAERDKLKDQLLRTAADFDNFRKRARKDVDDAKARGRDDVLREILDVADNLERAAQAAEGATNVQAVADGVRLVLRSFEDLAGRLGLERVACVGERFDPSIHDAVQQVDSAEHEPGTIVTEVQSGYRIAGRLVRPALVVVSKSPAN